MSGEKGVVLMAVIRDYECAMSASDTVNVRVSDVTKTSYAKLPTVAELKAQGLSFITYTLNSTFKNCINLETAPEIPNGVSWMYHCFEGCSALTTAPAIPFDVGDTRGCFLNCVMLTGDIEISGNLNPSRGACADMFKGTQQSIRLYGGAYDLDEIAQTSTAGNITVIRPASTPTWQTPVVNRTADSRTNANDINRIVGNTYLLGCFPHKYNYEDGDFIMDNEWSAIINSANRMAHSLRVAKITEKASYTNLNKLEAIHKQYYEYINA